MSSSSELRWPWAWASARVGDLSARVGAPKEGLSYGSNGCSRVGTRVCSVSFKGVVPVLQRLCAPPRNHECFDCYQAPSLGSVF